MWPRGHLCQRPQSCFRFWRQLAKVAASPADTGWGSRLVKREMWPAAGRRHPNGLQRLLVVTSASASASGAHSVLSREPPAAAPPLCCSVSAPVPAPAAGRPVQGQRNQHFKFLGDRALRLSDFHKINFPYVTGLPFIIESSEDKTVIKKKLQVSVISPLGILMLFLCVSHQYFLSLAGA